MAPSPNHAIAPPVLSATGGNTSGIAADAQT
jgi:hypothetical protein